MIPVKDVIGDEENDVATFVITNSDRSDNITANNNVTVPLIVSARASIRIQELWVQSLRVCENESLCVCENHLLCVCEDFEFE